MRQHVDETCLAETGRSTQQRVVEFCAFVEARIHGNLQCFGDVPLSDDVAEARRLNVTQVGWVVSIHSENVPS